MTESEHEASERRRKLKKTALALAIGGVAGFAGAMGMMHLMEMEALAESGPSVEIAALVGMLYALIGFAIGVGLLSPKAGAAYLNVEDADEIEEQRGILTYSALAMVVAGIALVVVALAGEGGLIDPAVAAGVYVISTVIAVWASLRSGKHQDELMRAMGRETASTAYYLIVLVGGTWALLAHLQYIAAPAPLDWLTMFWVLMLLAAFIVVGKRGMMTLR